MQFIMYVNFKQIRPILKDILSTPTSPFRETLVINKILGYLGKYDLNITVTRYNNIIANFGIKNGKKNLYFISHMDHPGFLVQEDLNDKVILKVMGGLPFKAKNLKEMVEVDINTQKRFIHRITNIIKKEEGNFVQIKPSRKVNPHNIFTLNLKDFNVKGDKVFARSIDDLGGCSAQICAGLYLFKHKQDLNVNVNFVFTRAEEVGFVGLISLIKNGYLCKDGYYISCETSKCIPPIQFGKGVVLRLGDRSGVFSQNFTNSLYAYFQKKMQLNKLPVQRALLDGGVCEATPLVVNNYQSSGFACPLGNYHNFNEKDNTIEEEFIDINDFTSYVDTIIETSLNFSKILDTYNKKQIQQRLSKNYNELKKNL